MVGVDASSATEQINFGINSKTKTDKPTTYIISQSPETCQVRRRKKRNSRTQAVLDDFFTSIQRNTTFLRQTLFENMKFLIWDPKIESTFKPDQRQVRAQTFYQVINSPINGDSIIKIRGEKIMMPNATNRESKDRGSEYIGVSKNSHGMWQVMFKCG